MAKNVPKYWKFIETKNIDIAEGYSDEIKLMCIRLIQRNPDERPSTSQLIKILRELPLFKEKAQYLEEEIRIVSEIGDKLL